MGWSAARPAAPDWLRASVPRRGGRRAVWREGAQVGRALAGSCWKSRRGACPGLKGGAGGTTRGRGRRPAGGGAEGGAERVAAPGPPRPRPARAPTAGGQREQANSRLYPHPLGRARAARAERQALHKPPPAPPAPPAPRAPPYCSPSATPCGCPSTRSVSEAARWPRAAPSARDPGRGAQPCEGGADLLTLSSRSQAPTAGAPPRPAAHLHPTSPWQRGPRARAEAPDGPGVCMLGPRSPPGRRPRRRAVGDRSPGKHGFQCVVGTGVNSAWKSWKLQGPGCLCPARVAPDTPPGGGGKRMDVPRWSAVGTRRGVAHRRPAQGRPLALGDNQRWCGLFEEEATVWRGGRGGRGRQRFCRRVEVVNNPGFPAEKVATIVDGRHPPHIPKSI